MSYLQQRAAWGTPKWEEGFSDYVQARAAVQLLPKRVVRKWKYALTKVPTGHHSIVLLALVNAYADGVVEGKRTASPPGEKEIPQ